MIIDFHLHLNVLPISFANSVLRIMQNKKFKYKAKKIDTNTLKNIAQN